MCSTFDLHRLHSIIVGFTISIVLILTILYYTRNREISYPTRLPVPSSSQDASSSQTCDALSLPSPPNQKYTKELWRKLQALFDEHAPAQRLSPGEFPQGIIDGPPFEVLDEFPVEQLDANDALKIHAHLVESLPSRSEWLFHGRGIVMVTGSLGAEFAATSLGMLRVVGSRLPVELWMLDQPTAKKGWCKELMHQGVACRYLENYVDDLQEAFPTEHQQVSGNTFLVV